ncbi:hypothetical protein GQ457_06G002980 [Hibiscus cannabinus]
MKAQCVFSELSLLNVHKSYPLSPPLDIFYQWTPPGPGFVKANVDASVDLDGRKTSATIIFRDEDGRSELSVEATMATFQGTQQKCSACDKTVYLVDKLTADNRIFHKACFRCHHCRGTLKVTVNGTIYHRSCFKCTHGGCTISPSNYIAHEGKLYCKHHHIQLFKEKGNYSQLETNDHEKQQVVMSDNVASMEMSSQS